MGTGVEEVTAEYKTSKVVVKGKDADPVKVCQRIQKKSGRKVEIISPLPKPPPHQNEQQQSKEEPKQENKEEVPFFSPNLSSCLLISKLLNNSFNKSK